ncbi:PfkB family carbohydrate kinase [Roseibacterium sp. SDUM158017]|uniref:PfkB family carbohydrate kinase n=1 Tax=Roseicyclus salinarum TaxID=3036773 RepID=UPI0024158D4A|nr:PfkB family carbohydrate kinase [Roseibacterium sp. SDUM158017]MDG4649548.1 PfkB family carbohydrate kinase [Roseibacterium sp. SDUM158017]
MSGLLVVGALHWDVVVRAPRLPRVDETLKGQAVDYRFGGKGGNQALAAARAGARTAFAGRVGADDPGRRMRAALVAAGVDVAGLQEGRGASGMSVAITRGDGAYGAVIVSGENLAIDAAALMVPKGCRMVLAQNEIAAATLGLLPGLAQAAGAEFWLNAAPADDLPEGLLRQVDGLIVNRLEAGDLLGSAALSPGEMVEGLSAMATRATVIVTLGEEGVAHAVPGGDPVIAPARRVEVRSTHGAGDMFAGSLAAAILRGDDVGAAVAFAQERAAALISSRR